MKTKILYFDTETTGLLPKEGTWKDNYKSFPHIVQLAWITNTGKEYSFIIKPNGWIIPEKTTAIHGISQYKAETEGEDFKKAVTLFITDCLNADTIVAHNIHFDDSIIRAMILRELGKEFYEKFNVDEALNLHKQIDTMKASKNFVNAKFENGNPGKYPRLEELYDKLFPGEKFPAHDALEDVKALVRCTPELIKLNIIKL